MTQFQYQDAQSKPKGDGISYDQGPLLDNEAINQPQTDSDRK